MKSRTDLALAVGSVPEIKGLWMNMIEVKSPMNGTVLELLVAVGDAVTRGQELVILESMKMEIPVESPSDGSIAEICVDGAETVGEDDLLMRLEVSA